MKRIFWMAFLMVGLLSCKEKETPDACGTTNPDKELSWLKSIIDENTPHPHSMALYAPAEIYSYSYQNQTYFSVELCMDCPDGAILVYNCQGEVFCQSGGIAGSTACDDFFKYATQKKLIWKR